MCRVVCLDLSLGLAAFATENSSDPVRAGGEGMRDVSSGSLETLRLSVPFEAPLHPPYSQVPAHLFIFFGEWDSFLAELHRAEGLVGHWGLDENALPHNEYFVRVRKCGFVGGGVFLGMGFDAQFFCLSVFVPAPCIHPA